MKSIVVFITENITTLATVLGVAVGAFIALKAIVLISQGVMLAYNGIMNLLAVHSMIKYIASTQGMTYAQAAFNVVLSANPIGLIIIGIAALIALITIIIVKYDEWGAALSLILFPLGMIINLIQSFRRNWDMITQAFENDGIFYNVLGSM